MTAATPGGVARRAVIVRRSTEFELLLARHATRGQAAFFLESRGQKLERVEAEHERIHGAIERVLGAIPARWRRAQVQRDDLDRFLFEPTDVVVVVGQDGLVANVSKYLNGQFVLGVNPLPERFDGVLVQLSPEDVAGVYARIEKGGEVTLEQRTMVEARLDDSQTLVALNEVFIGHRSHQSARYRIRWCDRQERHSSSGVIVTTGTGATGWARSVNLSRGEPVTLPRPVERRLAFFVREPFPSVATQATLCAGVCDEQTCVELTSEINEGGVIFGDGIEDDYLRFEWGQKVRVGVAARTLNLVAAAERRADRAGDRRGGQRERLVRAGAGADRLIGPARGLGAGVT